jgi:hypothetical protein
VKIISTVAALLAVAVVALAVVTLTAERTANPLAVLAQRAAAVEPGQPPPTPLTIQIALMPPPTAAPTPPAPLPPVLTFRVTERMIVGGLAVQVREVRVSHLSEFPEAAAAQDDPRNVLTVDLSQESFRTDRRANYGPQGLIVRDSDGFEYRSTTFNRVRALKSGEMNLGEIVRGEAYFVVPSTAKGFTLSFIVGLSTDATHYQWVRVPLGL